MRGDFLDGDAFLLEQLRGAAGGEDLDAVPGQRARQLDDAGLVLDADQRPGEFHHPRLRH